MMDNLIDCTLYFNSSGHILAVGDAHVFPGFLTPVPTQISFQSHRLLFSHVSTEVRGKNTPERNFASARSRTHNRQVMSPTRSPLSHPGGANDEYIRPTFCSLFILKGASSPNSLPNNL